MTTKVRTDNRLDMTNARRRCREGIAIYAIYTGVFQAYHLDSGASGLSVTMWFIGSVSLGIFMGRNAFSMRKCLQKCSTPRRMDALHATHWPANISVALGGVLVYLGLSLRVVG